MLFTEVKSESLSLALVTDESRTFICSLGANKKCAFSIFWSLRMIIAKFWAMRGPDKNPDEPAMSHPYHTYTHLLE